MNRVLVVNGPNLNLLGVREREVYGTTTLPELEARIAGWGDEIGVEIEAVQSSHEGAIIDALHAARDTASGVVINPGAFSHYSYAIHDAIRATDLPTVEIHISNIHAREPWRRMSVTAPACDYVVYGRGTRGYRDALLRLVNSASIPAQRIAYGDGPDQFGELRVPPGPGPHPVAVLFHGGFWLDPWTADLMDGVAIGFVERGWAAWNLEYRRIGGGGGFPATLEDAAGGIDELRDFGGDYELDLGTVAVVGHSAGGQLALWLAARPRLYDGQPDAPNPVRPATVVGLAAVSDLATAHRLRLGVGAVEKLLGHTPDQGPDRYALASPRALLPLGTRQIVVHGVEDQVVPFEMSSDYAAAADDAGDEVELVGVQDADHFDIIGPLRSAWMDAVTQRPL